MSYIMRIDVWAVHEVRAMKTKSGATIEDLYAIEGKAELIEGEIVRMSPTQKLPNYAAGEIFASLREHAKRTKSGHAATDNLGFVVDLPGRRSFSPDVAFYRGKLDMEFAEGGPAFAVEIRSAGDYGARAERLIAQKRADYFASGTLVLWDVDLLSDEVVRVYRSDNPNEPTVYGRGEVAEAEPAVLGWTMPLDELFPPED
jgi:Uma2 family endonuclease